MAEVWTNPVKQLQPCWASDLLSVCNFNKTGMGRE